MENKLMTGLFLLSACAHTPQGLQAKKSSPSADLLSELISIRNQLPKLDRDEGLSVSGSLPKGTTRAGCSINIQKEPPKITESLGEHTLITTVNVHFFPLNGTNLTIERSVNDELLDSLTCKQVPGNLDPKEIDCIYGKVGEEGQVISAHAVRDWLGEANLLCNSLREMQ